MALNNRVELLAPVGAELMRSQHCLALPPFAPQVLAFLGDLSQILCADPRTRSARSQADRPGAPALDPD